MVQSFKHKCYNLENCNPPEARPDPHPRQKNKNNFVFLKWFKMKKKL